MTTQVIFKIDKKLKDQAMRKAKDEGIAFSSVLKLATKAFVENQINIGLVGEEVFNKKTRRELEKISKDIKLGKNLSSKFKTVEEIKKYLLK